MKRGREWRKKFGRIVGLVKMVNQLGLLVFFLDINFVEVVEIEGIYVFQKLVFNEKKEKRNKKEKFQVF